MHALLLILVTARSAVLFMLLAFGDIIEHSSTCTARWFACLGPLLEPKSHANARQFSWL